MAAPLNRYLVFDCPQYYPTGGMGDCLGAYKDEETAKRALAGQYTEDPHIFDIQTQRTWTPVLGWQDEPDSNGLNKE